MKVQKAIKILDYIAGENILYKMGDKEISAIEMAMEALEKQIPKKPYLEGDGYADGYLVYDTWICPHCEKHYEVDYDDYDYCPNCGQKIDWSEQNDETE